MEVNAVAPNSSDPKAAGQKRGAASASKPAKRTKARYGDLLHVFVRKLEREQVDSGPNVRLSSGTEKKRAPRKLPGVSDEDFKGTKLVDVKKRMNGFVKTLVHMVDADWHDGYEEVCDATVCAAVIYAKPDHCISMGAASGRVRQLKAVVEIAQSVLEIVSSAKTGFER